MNTRLDWENVRETVSNWFATLQTNWQNRQATRPHAPRPTSGCCLFWPVKALWWVVKLVWWLFWTIVGMGCCCLVVPAVFIALGVTIGPWTLIIFPVLLVISGQLNKMLASRTVQRGH